MEEIYSVTSRESNGYCSTRSAASKTEICRLQWVDHSFCKECIDRVVAMAISEGRFPKCPQCRYILFITWFEQKFT